MSINFDLFRTGRETETVECQLSDIQEYTSWSKDENGVAIKNEIAPGKEAYQATFIIPGREKPIRPIVLKSAFKNGIVPSIGLNPIPCRIETVQVKYYSKQQKKEVEGMNVVSVVYNDEDFSDKSLKVMIAKTQQSFQL